MELEPKSWDWIYSHSDSILSLFNEDEQSAINDEESNEPKHLDMIDYSFFAKLKTLQKNMIATQYQLACLSTLGGAYHLCNRPKVALALAQKQELVGKKAGSVSVIVRSKVFQAVNHRLLGHKHISKLLFDECFSLANSSIELTNFIQASKDWLYRNYPEESEECIVSEKVEELF